MTLSAGTRLGPYEILAPIGAGGMGEVFQARDTRLDRIVAIKVSAEQFSERFEREARAVAALNHPHICTLYDVGPNYLVMEFIDGRQLKGPMPVDQAVRYAAQICDALDAAHRKRITHRDLKPGTILVTKAGVKLLDFGLAKRQSPATALDDSTVTKALTTESTIPGTLHYMAPEQLQGKEADARSDIFAFGLVLYEMLTGRRAFDGDNAASLIGAILHTEPPSVTPPVLERIVRVCLKKDPDERWQTAHDLKLQLEGLDTVPAASTVTKHSGQLFWKMAASVLFVAALGLAVGYFRREPGEARAIRSYILPPEKTSFSGTMALSPDGRRLAFVVDGPASLVWVRSLDTLSAQPLNGTNDAAYPYLVPGQPVYRILRRGQAQKDRCFGRSRRHALRYQFSQPGTEPGVRMARSCWPPAHFAPSTLGPLLRVSAAGGQPTPATQLDETSAQTTHRWPWFLPDGRHYLYLAGSRRTDAWDVYVASLDSQERKFIARAKSNPAYANGYLLFARDSTLMAQPFDAKRLEMTGGAIPVAERVRFTSVLLRSQFSVSRNGLLVYQTGADTPSSVVVWSDRTGKQTGAIGQPANHRDIQLSPDGTRAASQIVDPQLGADVWIYDLARGVRTRFTFDAALETAPVWSPDGGRIAFCSNRKGHFDLFQKVPGGAGNDELLLESNNDKLPTSWSPDGRYILYHERSPKTKTDLWVLPLFGERKPSPYLQTEFNEDFAQFSPDGRWIAYSSDEARRYEVYVAPFPGPGARRQISTHGGGFPRWRRDGAEIYYTSPDAKLMAVEVKAKGDTLEVRALRPLFDLQPDTPNDVTADGQRFLIVKTPEQSAPSPLTLVVNWTADLKK